MYFAAVQLVRFTYCLFTLILVMWPVRPVHAQVLTPDSIRLDTTVQLHHTPSDTIAPGKHHAAPGNKALADSIIRYANTYLGNRYKVSGTGKGGFDCSGFVCHVMIRFGYKLPHSSAAQGLMGIAVSKYHAQKGDLIFFKGHNYRSKRIGHVGIVISNDNGVITFIHATIHNGIMVNKSNELYYRKRFVSTRRILKP